ncbi:phragmoplast orienting kinesin 2 [Phtheirospermum japonicum]|uniref:Phragmoplast orienting kinesin 2 n=1 Tax=Phtheirospermum japonicum TaxID=374723 RepID=A0A830CFU9_9LAMI|nr:phragmoplast orienting kinesin 2 [Phtheirospermum japonicum]
MMSAIKTRFGYHPNQQPDAAETAPPPVKSSSSPDLLLKSASRDIFLVQSSSYKDKSSKSDDGETTSCAPSRSFEFSEDPNFWREHNVQVIIRLRPLSNAELSVQGNNRCVRQDSSQAITWAGPPESRFTFDLVADENVTQEMLFKVAGVSLVENCMEGYNSCMFAYGQTGSGKTHTMLGDIEGGTRRHSVNCGMTPRVFEYLFSRIQKDKDARREEKLKFTCKCSFLEIYNEQILDLLDPSSANLQIREDNKKGIYVENITEVEVSSARDVIQQLIQGAANRKVAATNMNRASSRSHSVFTCIIESKWDSQGVTHHRFARLNLVDLAGSERQKSSGAEGERLKEATNINKSLSTLGLVIMNLVSISNGKSIHVPYRDSKLTFLLQDSLGGNAKTIIIANISPSSSCSLETLSTLKFAQRAKFIKNHAIVNEDASGDVLALRIENQNLKKEVSRLRSLVHGGAESHDADVLSISFPGSPGSFKWEGHHGFSSPIISEKRTPHLQKKEYEVALVGVLRREKDKDTALQALVAENQATLQLAKQREDEIQGLKMRLRFREAGIKRLESVASGKLSAETHLQKEREEHLKEIEVLRGQVDRNQEVTRFAMENLRLKEEIRRQVFAVPKLKSFCEEGERERLNEQIMILQNKLLEALDWKLMHESDPANIQKESHVQSDNDFLISNQSSASPWRTSTNEENEFLRMQAIQNQSELDSLHKRLNFIVEEKEKLERHVNDLAKELEAERLSKETMAEEAQKEQTKLTSLINIGQSDQAELKTMVDAIASASQREAEAHEMAIFLSKENDELRMKLKVLIDDNNKLIDLYESAVAGNRTKISDNSHLQEDDPSEVVVEEKELETKLDFETLKCQLTEMHEENDKLLSLYEKAMQERDELKKVIASGQREDKGNLVEIDGGECLSFNDASSCFDNKHEIEELDATVPDVQEGEHSESSIGEHLLDETSLYEVHVEDDDYIHNLIDSQTSTMEVDESKEPNEHEESYSSAENTDAPIHASDMSKDLNSIREKLAEAQEKLSYSAQTLSMFGALERAVIEVDMISDKIGKLEKSIQAKQQERENLKSLSTELHERKDLANRKLSALKNSLMSFSSSVNYFEQREAQASSRLDVSSKKLSQKKEELNGLHLSRHEVTNALLKVKQVENELRNSVESLRSKVDEENRKLESERVLFAIDNVENRNWQVSSKATALLKSEEEKTKLQNEIKLRKEKLGDAKKETEALTKTLGKLDGDMKVLEVEIEKEMLSVEEMNRKVENIVKEKEMLSEVQENGREEFERMVVEYYEKMFEAELKEEEAGIVHEEVLMETTEMEGLLGAKDEAVRRKTALLESLSCETRFVSENVETDVRSMRTSVVELNSLLELCGSMESQLCV